MIVERLNNDLKLLFNTEDPVYKSFICDKDGTIPSTVTKPTDIDIGAIASLKEFLRILSICLLKQIFIDQASEEFLTYTLNEYFGSLRLEGETDEAWIARTISKVFNPKVSRAAIIVALRPFSSQEPEITNISTESAFADFSFADIYISGYDIVGGETIVVVPAISESFQSSFFSIKVKIFDTPSSQISTVVDLLNNIIAAGIDYILEIEYNVV